MMGKIIYTLDLGQITLKDVPLVGGKNESLGQLWGALRSEGVGVLDGFATTADAEAQPAGATAAA